jgi:hypothetical protein
MSTSYAANSYNLALTFKRLQMYDEAAKHFVCALKVYVWNFGANNKFANDAKFMLKKMLLKQGKYTVCLHK